MPMTEFLYLYLGLIAVTILFHVLFPALDTEPWIALLLLIGGVTLIIKGCALFSQTGRDPEELGPLIAVGVFSIGAGAAAIKSRYPSLVSLGFIVGGLVLLFNGGYPKPSGLAMFAVGVAAIYSSGKILKEG
jgi:hypothetical protein